MRTMRLTSCSIKCAMITVWPQAANRKVCYMHAIRKFDSVLGLLKSKLNQLRTHERSIAAMLKARHAWVVIAAATCWRNHSALR